MNHIYRSIYNHNTGTFQAVPETAKAHGKGKSTASGIRSVRHLYLRLSALSLAIAAVLPMSVVWAEPTGGNVVAGQASITQQGNTTTINQSSQSAAINWQRFSSQANEAINFNQPNASAIALNRVVGNEASVLNGSLTANGQVFIVNPNGVLTGKNATFNTAGLVLSTGNISDQDFMNGKYQFSNAKGSINHQGSINGGYVAMIAPNINNSGHINANGKRVELAAADTVTLNINNGSLAGITIDKGTLNAMIDNGGAIRSEGGVIHLTTKGYDQASKAVINHSGIIEANTSTTNDKGEIVLLSDMQTGTTTISGTLNAKADHANTDGGFIETSGATVNVTDAAKISTQATAGKTGEWLIDPKDFTIATSGGNITGTQLSNNLGSSSITIKSIDGTDTGTSKGDIFVNDDITWQSGNTLTLNAQNDIHINNTVDASQGSGGKLVLEYAQSNATGDYYVKAPVNLQAGQNFSTKKGTVIKNYTVITDVGQFSDATTTPATMTLQGITSSEDTRQGNYVLGADIDANITSGWDSSRGFKPIGTSAVIQLSDAFRGTFDGLGHTISNLTINRPSEKHVGLFGYTFNATLQNVAVSKGSITGDGAGTGGLVGFNNRSRISNSSTNLTITGTGSGSGTGGLVGYNEQGAIVNSHADGSVNGGGDNSSAGGLIGYNRMASIKNSYAVGDVNSTGGNKAYTGGLVGYNDGAEIDTNYATGKVTGGNGTTNTSVTNTGGLVGFNNENGKIRQSYAIGIVKSGNTVSYADTGGLVGKNRGDIKQSYATGDVTGGTKEGYADTGGLVGENRGNIDQSYATGDVTGVESNGGLVGYNYTNIAKVSKSYATGKVSGGSYNGGLVGYNLKGNIIKSYATGKVSNGSKKTGGLVAHTDVATLISNSYWDKTITTKGCNNSPTCSGATGLTTAEMKKASSFDSWSIDKEGGQANVWRIYEGKTAPLLKAFMKTVTVTPTGGTSTVTYNGKAQTYQPIRFTLSDNADQAKVQGSITGVSGKDVGTYTESTIKGLYSEQQGYDLVGNTPNLTLTINKADLTLSGSRTYDGTTTVKGSTLTATGVNGETFSITGDGNTTNLSSKNASTTAQTLASLTGLTLGSSSNGGLSANYNALTNTGSQYTINKASLTLSAKTDSRTYDGTTTSSKAPTYTGLVSGDSLTGLSQSFDSKNAGSRTLTVGSGYTLNDGNDGNNYNVTTQTATGKIAKANLTATANNDSKTYDGKAYTGGNGVTYSGFVGGDNASVLNGSLAYGGSSQNAKDAGSYDISASGQSAKNYDITYQGGKLTIGKANLTATTNNDSKTYDGKAYTGGNGVTYSGFVGGDNASVLNGSLAYGGSSQNAKDAGSYAISASGQSAKNYDITYQGGKLTIGKANLTATANNDSKIYDGKAYTDGNGVTYSGFVGGDNASVLNGSLAYGGSSQNAKDAGSYDISASGQSAKNYDITYQGGKLTIGKANLTATANNDSKTYDGKAYTGGNGVTYSGFVGGESDSVLGGTLIYGGSAQGAIDVGTYDLTVSGQTAVNYDIVYSPGRLSITDSPVDPVNPANQQAVELQIRQANNPPVSVDSDCYGQADTNGEKGNNCSPVITQPNIEFDKAKLSPDVVKR